MNTYSGNKNPTGNFMRVANAINDKAFRNCHTVEVAKVTYINNSQYQCQTLAQQFNFTAIKIDGLTINSGDIVVVVFCDTDFRRNLLKARNNIALTETEGELHSMSYGIIIGKL